MLTFAQWFPRAAIAALPFVMLIGCASTPKEEPASARADTSAHYASHAEEPWKDVDPDPKARAGSEREDEAQTARATVTVRHEEPARPAAQTQKPAAPAPAPAPAGDGWVRGRMAFPTGDTATSVLLIEKSIPAEVFAGK